MAISGHPSIVEQQVGSTSPVAGEAVFFQDRFALVTNLKCVFSNEVRVYATSGITSVGMSSTEQSIVGSAFLAGLGLGYLYYNGPTDQALLVALICIGVAYGLYWLGRPWHTLSLHTAGGAYKPLKSREQEYIARVLMAINEAIMRRG